MWQNVTEGVQSTRLAAAATHLASLPSTNAFFTKWKNNCSSGVPRDELFFLSLLKSADRKLKRKHRRENPFDDNEDDPAKSFFAAFGKACFVSSRYGMHEELHDQTSSRL